MLTGKAIIALVAALFAGIGAIGNALWGPRAQARKRLDAGKTTTIVDREIVTLTGIVRALGELLEAPLSGKQCVLYAAFGRVIETKGATLTSRAQTTLLASVTEVKLVPFELETPDGIVRIDEEAVEIEIPPDPLIPRKIERERQFLLAHGQTGELVRGSSFEELALVPGTKIRVQGMAIVELDPAPGGERGYREDARRIRLVPHENHPLTIGRPRR
jgi:hypothetical protein